MGITDAWLRRPWKDGDRDQWLSDGGTRGAARLVAKRAKSGVTFYFQYFDTSKRKRFLHISPYDANGRRGLSLQAARDRASELSKISRSVSRNLHDHFAELRRQEEEAKRIEEEQARIAEEHARSCTLRQLVDMYVQYLHKNRSAKWANNVEGLVRIHLYETFPALLNRRASTVTSDDFVEVIGSAVRDAGGTTAIHLRACLHAAFNMALRAKTNPLIPAELRAFGIASNPISAISAMAELKKVGERNLSRAELGCFLRRLAAKPQVKSDVLLACLYLGGQRPTQLLRITTNHVDLASARVTIWDPKGKRTAPREHLLPMTDPALEIFRRRMSAAKPGGPVFSYSGDKATTTGLASHYVGEISELMLEAGECTERFTLKDVRRTCETILASMGVPKHVRGHIQSHGLSGVQDRTYDKYDYAVEKREALERFGQLLLKLASGVDTGAEVISPIFGARRKALSAA